MSLINDALKRAGQAQPPPPPTGEAAPPPLRPAEHKSQPRWFLALVPIVLFVLALAGWFVIKGLQVSRELSSDAGRLPLVARESTPQAAHETVVPKAAQLPPVAAVTNTATTNVEANAVEPAKPSAPEFKLQGIFYRPARPAAMVNSKTVYVGDRIANAKVVAIGRESVTLQYDGQTKVLTLD